MCGCLVLGFFFGLSRAHVGHVHQLYGLLFSLYRVPQPGLPRGGTIFNLGAKDFQFLLISNEYTRPVAGGVVWQAKQLLATRKARVVQDLWTLGIVHSGIPIFSIYSGSRTCTDSCRKMTKQFMPHAWRKSNLIRKLLWPSWARTAVEGDQDMHVSQDVLRYWPYISNLNPSPIYQPNPADRIEKRKIKYLQFILTTTTRENKTKILQ